MHELSITESILEIALRHADQARARKITALHLVIGQLSSFIDDSIQFYWDIIAKDTIAEGAHLFFRRVPTEMLCLACQQRYSPGDEDFLCPNCGGRRIKVVAGEEFYLESLEIESSDTEGTVDGN